VMSTAGRMAARSEMGIADRTDVIAQRQMEIAGREDMLALETEKAAKTAQTGAFISAGIKAASSIATLFI